MARDVLIRLKKLSTTGKVPANAAVRFEPTVLRADADGYILDDYFDAVMVDGEATVTDLPETDLNWAYKVQVRGHGRGAGLKQVYATWYVHLPAGEGTVNFEDLPRIDPKTLTPINDPDPAWVDAVTAVFTDSVAEAVPTTMVAEAEKADSPFRSALNAASAQSIADPASPVHAAVVNAVGGVVPEGVVTSQDFGTFKFSTDPNEEAPAGTVLFYMPPPTTLFTDFSSAEVGSAPSGWTEHWNGVGTWEVIQDDNAANGVSLRCTNATTGEPSGFEWNQATALLDGAGDGELVFKWMTTNAAVPARGLIAGSGTTGNGYHAGRRNATSEAFGLLVDGTQTMPLNGAENATSYVSGTWMVTRFRKIGSTLSARTWVATDPEPSTWTITTTDTTHTTGWFGLYSRPTAAANHTIDWVGFAAGDRTAPKGA